MLEIKKGCKVPYPEKLSEGYEITDGVICANVNASKVKDMMREFILRQKEYILFILEIPTHRDDEEKLWEAGASNFHRDVYILPCRDADTALAVLKKYGDLLINDGMNLFGFRGDKTGEEMTFDKYNILTLFGEDIPACREFLESHGIYEQTPLVTAWQTFEKDKPGVCDSVKGRWGASIYNIPKKLKKYGLVFVERRED